MPKFISFVQGGPLDGSQSKADKPIRDGDIIYVPIRVGCLLPGQSVATERRHVYRFHASSQRWIYRGVE